MSESTPRARMCAGCAVGVWADAEHRYAAGGYTGTGGAHAVRTTPGAAGVVVTAAAAVRYWRGTAAHPASRWTGSAAEAVAAASGATALCAAGPARQVPDAPDPALAARLRELTAAGGFVLDLGGMRDRQVDCCLGLGPAPDRVTEQVAAALTRALSTRGLRVAVNEPFAGRGAGTVTAFAQRELDVAALQLHLAAWLRDPVEQPTIAGLVLDAVVDGLRAGPVGLA